MLPNNTNETNQFAINNIITDLTIYITDSNTTSYTILTTTTWDTIGNNTTNTNTAATVQQTVHI